MPGTEKKKAQDRERMQRNRQAQKDRISELEKSLHEIVAILSDSPEYHYQGMGCGIEDRGIYDRYDAMQYGWDEAMERAYSEHVNPARDIALISLEPSLKSPKGYIR